MQAMGTLFASLGGFAVVDEDMLLKECSVG